MVPSGEDVQIIRENDLTRGFPILDVYIYLRI